MPTNPIIMPIVFVVLLLLPMKLAPKNLMKLAFFLWLTGGLTLATTGFMAFQQASLAFSPFQIALYLGITTLIGVFKGKVILSKTSQRNIDRIQSFEGPQRPLQVYSVRSWMTIGVMVLISLSLTWFGFPLEWRGIVRLAIGLALVVSSLNYLQSPKLSPESVPSIQ